MLENISTKDSALPTPLDPKSILRDFEICCISREASLLSRKEVLTGKAKFGITGDGKELPQVALARVFQHGDWRSGYYRDQTLMLALGITSAEEMFAQLYADTENDPFSRGRQMNNHYATPITDSLTGEWANQREQYNISADISSTAGQMARAVGLALASEKYRTSKALRHGTVFSHEGNEVCFATIGDASTSEGVFWESINAAAVMQVPLIVSVWDDGYGISVPIEFQTTKGSISAALAGMETQGDDNGIFIRKVKAWDYPALVEAYAEVTEMVRKSHRPALVHVEEVTQPQGHSTSGSHERYKSKERLIWERDYDCLSRFEQWIVAEGIATEEETRSIRSAAKRYVRECRDRAWKAYHEPTMDQFSVLQGILANFTPSSPQVKEEMQKLHDLPAPLLSELLQHARRIYFLTLTESSAPSQALKAWISEVEKWADQRFHTDLHSASPHAALQVPVVPPKYSANSQLKSGYEILNAFFDKALARDARIFAFGEDVGKIGDVNQGFAGLQKKHGSQRVFDTGIREWTIMGQAIGMAMRGLRPIAEIQYLDYLIYGLEPLNDDLATLRYRSGGIQQAPAIIRTRGHRLEGIWHSGSPMGMIINSLRGIYVLVPRDMTQAAGMYNTMLKSDDPALIVECLNGYRLKERLPDNIGEYTVPLGVPEVLIEGNDITIVTYGSCVRVAEEACRLLNQVGIYPELIDAQTLLPFDLEHRIVESLKKTNRVLFLDEDVPGGATAFMLQQVLEIQGGYRFLDSAPITLTAHAHRPPYGSDGDYFTKPNPEDVLAKVYKLLQEAEPYRFPVV